jgi:hypothetical protein
MAGKKKGLRKREQREPREKKFDLYGEGVGKSSPPIYKNPNVASYTEKTQASSSGLPFVS